VIASGGIDLSIGSIVAVAGVLVGITQVKWGWAASGLQGAALSLLVALGAGLLAGLVNGVLVAYLRIAPFVITLGMMVVARGLAMIFSGGSSISPMGEMLNDWTGSYLGLIPTLVLMAVPGILLLRFLARGKMQLLLPLVTLALFGWSFCIYRGLPSISLFLIIVLNLLAFIMRYTVFGRSVYAVGSNERAAYWAGVEISKVNVWIYAIMGLLAGLSGLLLAARLNGADPNAGQMFELDAIAAVVIGGTSLKGGSGTILGSLVGALTIASLNNGMDLLGVSSFYQMVFKGIIIIAAVSLDQSQRKAI
jgi:D-xylose transport system permease protein